MISVATTKQQALDILATGDPHRSIVLMSTPYKLAFLNMLLAIYHPIKGAIAGDAESMRIYEEIRNDLEKVVGQILQQEFPQS